MSNFLKMVKNINGQSKDQISKMFQTLEENIENISNLASITALLDKIQIFTSFDEKGLESKILGRSLQIFENSYDFSDNGDLLRAVVLVVSLRKIKHHDFYDRIFTIIGNNTDKIGYFNLITMLESYTYNKILLNLTKNERLLDILTRLNSSTTKQELQYISKVTNVYSSLNKMKSLIKETNFVENFDKIYNEITNTIYEILIEVMMMNKQNSFLSKSFNIMNITDILLSLDTIQANQEIQLKHKKFIDYYNDMINVLLPKDFIVDKINYKLSEVMIFVKKYHVAPAINLNVQISNLISMIFIKHYNNEISQNSQNLIHFLLFLAKTNQLKLQSNMITNTTNKLLQYIKNEKNPLKLPKILEYCSIIHSNGNKDFIKSADELYKELEPKIFNYLMKLNNISVATPIIQIFQNLVQMNKGNSEHWIFLFNKFSSKNTLRKLGNMDLIIRLIPAAAIKTRNLYKISSNISSYGAMHYHKQIQLDAKFTDKIENFWLSVEDVIIEKLDEIYPEKYPVILFHLVYANITKQKITRVFVKVKDKILKNLHVYDGKKINEIIYSYARVKERADDLFFAISEKLKKEDKLIASMTDSEVVNTLWGFANLRVYDKELFDLIINRLFLNFKNLGDESFTELCQAIAILNYPLSHEHLSLIVDRFNTQLDNFGNTLLQKKDKSRDNGNFGNTLHQSRDNVNTMNDHEAKSVTMSFLLVITHSLIVIENFQNKTLWDKLLNILIINRKLWEVDSSSLYYVYLMYFHLQGENVEIKYTKELYDILYENYKEIINYLAINKKHHISKFEKICKKIIIDNSNKILSLKIQESPEIYELKMNSNHKILHIQNYQKINEIHKILLEKGFMVFPYKIDLLADPYAFEINGPWHYHIDSQNKLYVNGYDNIKKRMIEKIGLKYIEIPFTVNNEKEAVLTNNIIDIMQKIK